MEDKGERPQIGFNYQKLCGGVRKRPDFCGHYSDNFLQVRSLKNLL